MSNVCPSLPDFNSVEEGREVVAGLMETIVSYARVLGQVQPALSGHPELSALVKRTLEP